MAEGIDKEFLLKALVEKTIESNSQQKRIRSKKEILREVDLLQEYYEKLNSSHDFSVGDLVKWKEGLKNRKRPDYGQPAIVLRVIENAIVDPEATPSTQYYNEPLDLALGILDDDDDLLIFHFDSRKFEPFAAVSE